MIPAHHVRMLAAAACLALPIAAMGGCQAPGVGDPCEPEQIPPGGFVQTEAYLETSSVQCRTRVCMVYRLAGTPDRTSQNTLDRVYCTCRCAGPGDRHCECPEDYACTEILTGDRVGDGIKGSYCVLATTVVDG